MRIHSNTLTRQDFTDAARAAGVSIVELSEHGSRSRARAFKFALEGTSGRPRGFGAGGEAATWDEWGIVFAHLFDVDPDAHTGKNGYLSSEHFHWVTGDRFKTLTPLLQHPRHKWGFGHAVDGDESQRQADCECGAVSRWPLGRHEYIAELTS